MNNRGIIALGPLDKSAGVGVICDKLVAVCGQLPWCLIRIVSSQVNEAGSDTSMKVESLSVSMISDEGRHVAECVSHTSGQYAAVVQEWYA